MSISSELAIYIYLHKRIYGELPEKITISKTQMDAFLVEFQSTGMTVINERPEGAPKDDMFMGVPIEVKDFSPGDDIQLGDWSSYFGNGKVPPLPFDTIISADRNIEEIASAITDKWERVEHDSVLAMNGINVITSKFIPNDKLVLAQDGKVVAIISLA